MTIRLTQTVQKGGCAAKISAEILRETLSKVDFSSNDPQVLIDSKDFDDAGIYQISPDLALVQTLDFFTPIVDTPYLFGQIAATNALSDVYAMGGLPKTAMAILAFPLATLDPIIMREMMEGAQAKVKEAHCTIVGGHSIDDETLKFGLSVTGLVHPNRILSNQKARPGDTLILTKALGTGTLCAGLKNGDYSEDTIQEAIQSMTQLNSLEGLFDEEDLGALHAATDITGFGLLGHSLQIARASKVTLDLESSKIPVFELTHASLKAENLTKAHRSNRSYTSNECTLSETLTTEEALTLFDPQTSGGLLLSVSSDQAPSILKKLKSRFQATSAIGRVSAFQETKVRVHA